MSTTYIRPLLVRMEERPDRLDVLEVIPVRHVLQRENGRATYSRSKCQWNRSGPRIETEVMSRVRRGGSEDEEDQKSEKRESQLRTESEVAGSS